MAAWRLIQSPKLSGQSNMRSDLQIFNAFEKGSGISTLRIYSWQPQCISLGYSQKTKDLIDEQKAKSLGWDVVKRPTGGGIVFHNEAEVTYSLVTAIDNPILPAEMISSYKKILEAIVCAIRKAGIDANIARVDRPLRPVGLRARPTRNLLCFSYPAEHEIVVNSKKIVGSAQKRGKRALLQQGSIFVRRIDASAYAALKEKADNIDAISVEEILGRAVPFKELSAALVKGFEERLEIKFKT